jgi:hypothetical protein
MLGRRPRANSLSDSSGSSSGRTTDPRPNVLTGQVAPNALSTRGGRPAANQSSGAGARTPVMSPSRPAPPAPNRTAAAPAAASATAPSALPGSLAQTRPRTRRPFSLWTVLVVGFIVINLARGFLAAGSPDATESPPTAAPRTAQPASSGPSGATAGVIEFGTVQHDDCSLEISANAFATGAHVLWWAHFKHLIAAKASVEWSIEHDGSVLESGTGPADTAPGPWGSICSSFPFRYFAAGDYTMEIWTAGHGELLSKGSYTLHAPGSTSGGPSPSASP